MNTQFYDKAVEYSTLEYHETCAEFKHSNQKKLLDIITRLKPWLKTLAQGASLAIFLFCRFLPSRHSASVGILRPASSYSNAVVLTYHSANWVLVQTMRSWHLVQEADLSLWPCVGWVLHYCGEVARGVKVHSFSIQMVRMSVVWFEEKLLLDGEKEEQSQRTGQAPKGWH